MSIDDGLKITLGDLVKSLGGVLHGDPSVEISRLATLEDADAACISFLHNDRYQAQLAGSKAACVVVPPAMESHALARGACIVAADPYLYFARLSQLFKRRLQAGQVRGGIHASAVVDEHAFVHPSAYVGPLCVLEAGAKIGAGTVLKGNVYIGTGCEIGERCLLHPGVVIGADGFGFAPRSTDSGVEWEKIEQLGAVRIGNEVEIGANTCIDRGALSDTVLEDGVKLDNLIQIGHNVQVGKHTAMAACVAVAGSARIGAYCTIGGASSISGHISLADHVHISGATVVTKSLPKKGTYTGVFPIDDHRSWEQNAAALRGLSVLRERLRTLEKNINRALLK
jgi:UDP-3-O-[3-hydroxymyristoyl] glucosamine N-acyltransferase